MCLAHYTQPHPCFGQLPKDWDISWWREGLTQGENRVTDRVIMLGGYFSLQREAEDMFACLLIHPSERIIGMSMTSSGLQPQLFLPFWVMHLTPPHTSSFSLARLQQISRVSGAIWKKIKCSTSFCNALQQWGLSSEGQAETLSNAHTFPKRDSCQCPFFPAEKNERFYFEPTSRIHGEWMTCHKSKMWVNNL